MKSLDSFTVNHFRGLRDLRLETLGSVNLLVGLNNSGKTSLLEALAIYCDPSNIRVWLNIARLRDQESKRERTPIIDALRWLLDESSSDVQTISMLSTGNFYVKQLQASYEEIEEIRVSERNCSMSINEKDEELENEESSENRQGLNLKIEFYTNHHNQQLSIVDEVLTFKETFSFLEGERFLSSSFRGLRKNEHSLPTAIVTTSSHRFESQTSLLSKAILENFKPHISNLLQYIDKEIYDIAVLVQLYGTASGSTPSLTAPPCALSYRVHTSLF